MYLRNWRCDNQSLLTILLVIYSISSFIIPIIGISIGVVYAIYLLLFILYVKVVRRFCVGRIEKKLIFLFVLLIAIDKLNDFFYACELKQLLSLIVSISIVLFFVFQMHRAREVWRLVRFSSLFCVIVFFIISFLYKIPLDALDRDASSLLYIFFVSCYSLSFWKKILLFFPIALIENFLFEARSVVVALIIYLLVDALLSFSNKKWLKKMLLITEIIFSMFVIKIAIDVESTIKTPSIMFTGRGLIWEQAVSHVFCGGSTYNLFLGFATTNESLEQKFGKELIAREKSKDEYMTKILLGGHFHNGIIYSLYNTGAFGLFLLFLCFSQSFKRLDYNRKNIAAFTGFYIIYVLNGRSIYGIYVLSIIMLLIILLPMEEYE